MIKRMLALLALAFALAGCGSGTGNNVPDTGAIDPGSGQGGNQTTLSMGAGTGSAFQAGQIEVTSSNLSAGGSTSLRVSIVDQTGALYTQPVTVTFSSPCAAQNLATITPSSAETSTGVANATYAARGCSGEDVVTASASVNNQNLTATTTLTVAAASVGSLEFVSATPTNIALKGTGGPGRQETSTVVFRVLDSTGGPRANTDVTFSLDTEVGGLRLSSTSGRSDANGRVQTIVSSGTVATTVRVTARIADPNISTQSSQLSVTTGIPDSNSFSLAPQCPNVEAFNVDGVVVPITVRLSDRFNNPVPDGTAVTFTAEGGQIVSQCQTTTTASGSGSCTVNWTSSNPRPTSNGVGRVSILATAIGEDSFVDMNGNGFFDDGEPYDDLGEPFRDDNENGTYDEGEFFFDFNNDGRRNASDGEFSGVRCTAGSNPICNLTTTAIGARGVIVMSTSDAMISGPALATVAAGGSLQLTYVVSDLNGNPLPAETTITATASSGAGSLEQPTSFTVPCTSASGGHLFNVFLTAPNRPGTGLVTITVTTPRGIVTTYRTNITVT